MKREYIIRRIIKAHSVQDALKNESKARLIEVYEKENPEHSTTAIGFTFPVNDKPDAYFDKKAKK